MFRIGEFSRLVRVSARMLRHYEKCALLVPAAIDTATGYRYYDAAQMPLLGRITALRDAGFSVAEIGSMLQHSDDAPYLERAIRQKERELNATIAGEQARLIRLGTLKDMMKKERNNMVSEVEIKELPKMTVLALREIIPAYAAEGTLWQKLGQYMARCGVAPEQDAYGYSIYWDEEFKERDVDVEVAIPVRQAVAAGGGVVCRETERVEQAAAVQLTGPYDGFAAAAEKLAVWIEANGYGFNGPMRSVTIRGPHNESDPEKYLIELQVPIQSK